LLQTDAVKGLDKVVRGLTVTITLSGLPEQLLAVGVMVYVTLACNKVVLPSVWLIEFPAPFDAPVTLPVGSTANVQLNVVPVTLLVSTTPVVEPEQIVCDAGAAFTEGAGLTLITTDLIVPEHPFAVGVIEYVTVPTTDPVVVRTWAILVPVPADAPETPDWTTVHAKEVPVTVLVKAMEGDVPEQIVCDTGVAVATGRGLTVITTSSETPAQLSAVGVTV
jgi:hypothetical protein